MKYLYLILFTSLLGSGNTWIIQTMKTQRSTIEERKTKTWNHKLLQPSQTIKTTFQMTTNSDINILLQENNVNNNSVADIDSNIAGDTIVFCVKKNKKEKRNNDSKKWKRKYIATVSSITKNEIVQETSKKIHGSKHKRNITSGLIPDIEWRAISMEHLRTHPNFIPLPSKITNLTNPKDINQFRQDSWQWDELHIGRCTTSIASSALGFLDPISCEILNVPLSMASRYHKSGVSGGVKAYHRLSRSVALTTLDDFNRELCCDMNDDAMPMHDSFEKVWQAAANKTFVAKYIPTISKSARRQRRNDLKHIIHNTTIASIRMQWGSVQEATAILTAINYFSNCKIKEVGMCHDYPQEYYKSLETIGLYLGASPDAIILHPNGTSEILEVKNHCPFMFHKSSNRFRVIGSYPLKNNDNNSKSFTPMTTIQPMYIPQLMLEMFCYSSKCTSAIMLRQTIHGAYILRIRRNDDYIHQMIHWLSTFHKQYVLKQIPPEINFFWDTYPDYREFVYMTKYIAEHCVEVVDFVGNDCIQRMEGCDGKNVSLFLDHV